MLRLATRRSPLAQWQARDTQDRLARQGVASELVLIDSAGDRDQNSALSSLGGVGIFAVEIQLAVLEGRADVAVHSAKDLPSLTPEGLVLAAVPVRADARDVLVGATLETLAAGATVATGSPRRRAVLLHRRPDLNIVELRGNMATRLAYVERSDVDAIVCAAAALQRLGTQPPIVDVLDPTWCIPQVGQGAIALEARVDDEVTRNILRHINDTAEEARLNVERAFLRELGAGCSIPVAAHAAWHGDDMVIRALMAAPNGHRVVMGEQRASGPLDESALSSLGATLARHLRDDVGGGDLVGGDPCASS